MVLLRCLLCHVISCREARLVFSSWLAMATEIVVHDPRKRSMDAIQQRLQKDQLRQQQQQQKNDKDKKGASDNVNVSSKEPLKPHSLPTPTKKPTTKDLQDDGFAAYTKLSHSVDEKLLATNVKLSSGKKNIADKVLHTLLRSGDSVQKYLHGKNEKKIDLLSLSLLAELMSCVLTKLQVNDDDKKRFGKVTDSLI